MDTLIMASQLITALGLLNVWLLRRGKPTGWRGGDARNMREEFEVYGLPVWFMGFVGFLKVSLALLLLAGLWLPGVSTFAAGGIVVLMVGAVAMHLKVGDPFAKSLPALLLLVLSLAVALN